MFIRTMVVHWQKLPFYELIGERWSLLLVVAAPDLLLRTGPLFGGAASFGRSPSRTLLQSVPVFTSSSRETPSLFPFSVLIYLQAQACMFVVFSVWGCCWIRAIFQRRGPFLLSGLARFQILGFFWVSGLAMFQRLGFLCVSGLARFQRWAL